MLSKKLLMCCGSTDSEILPEAVDFDGTNDYLSRASDFDGNADGKEFTFSAWVYWESGTSYVFTLATGTTDNTELRFWVLGHSVAFKADNSSGTNILDVQTSTPPPQNTWVHVIISIDLTNTSNRHVYINDVADTATWATYTNDTIDFTAGKAFVGSNHLAARTLHQGRLSHVYMDYTYRDLSVEANRRLFITEDLKPADSATLAALNPIIYFPLTDPTTAHVNSGTGGNMTLNGTVALSERGPNQDNCVASVFDNVADNLTRTSIVGATGSGTTEFLFSMTFKMLDSAGPNAVIVYRNAGSNLTLQFLPNTDGFYLRFYGDGGTVANSRYDDAGVFSFGQMHHIVASGNASVSDSYKVFLDGVDVTASLTGTTLSNYNIRYDDVSNFYINRDSSGNWRNVVLGELYVDEAYTDLSTSNPFWDSDTNKPVPVRQVIENTGVTPLIAMPIRGDNAGLNLGSGGDFTVNSGPYTGARSASEHWARSINVDTGASLSRTISGWADSKELTLVMGIKLEDANNTDFIFHLDTPNTFTLKGRGASAPNNIVMTADSASAGILSAYTTWSCLSTTEWKILLISFDLTNASNRWIYSGHTNDPGNDVWGTYTNALINYSGATEANNVIFSSGINMGFFYFDNSYIDFSQEANRLLFVDAFGYPTDLQKKIDDGEVPEPLIYLPFDDTSDLGKNNGTGGDFTVNGTVTAGADVDPN